MSKSHDRLIDAAIDSLQAYILPTVNDDFARGQLFSVIFALNYLKLSGDWKLQPLLQQIQIQDAAFAKLLKLERHPDWPPIPTTPRYPENVGSAEALEILRDEGDRLIGQMLMCLMNYQDHQCVDEEVTQERILRSAVREQLKVELNLVPTSMLSSITAGNNGAAE